ncbi:proline-rich protein 14 isoform X2 [Pantherophis guttatus]|uniref:Proline-rich protein 14 isoform X2 n=1 Tax=Pantherophis guttatus TaxID=94885 RepID=A0A6P9BWE4_PANGU|nr:proline-rich protein 14 isoform X2 [Pantherophis guttatus]
MECNFPEGTSSRGRLPLSTFERIARWRKARPEAKEEGTPVHLLEPLDRGRTSPSLREDEKWSPMKRQRLQQCSLSMVEEGRDACGEMGETLWHVASPMEKKQRKVLAIDVEDFSTTQVPEIPQRRSLLQRPALFPSQKPLQVSSGNETKVSWPRNRQNSTVCRSLLPKVGSRLCQEPQAHTCRKLGDQRLYPPHCRESERLQTKRQRLQNGVPLINGREGIRATPEEEAHQSIPALEDCQLTEAQDAGVGQERLENFPSPCRSDQQELPHQSSSMETPVPSDLHDQEHHTGPSSETSRPTSASTLLRPSIVPRFRPWGLAPVFQSMRSKLEAFADIFLSPSKPSPPPAERSPPPSPRPPANADEVATTPPATPRPGVKIEVKIAISEPRPRKRSSCHEEEKEEADHLVVSGRPPIRQWRLSQGEPAPQPHLGRSYSCPDFPRACSWQNISSVLSPLPQLRQRRHTVCSLEVSRELDRPTLPCLRKEVYPFSSPPARLLPRPLVHTAHCDPSSYSSLTPSCCHEPDPVHSRNASLSPDGGQKVPAVGLGMVASEQLMLSEDEMKGSQENTEGKVSCIRIRKRPARHQVNLTPMGLPRPVRLKKEVFSLEEIYTNKNYHSPKEKRLFETIFEVPLERKGALVFTSQRKLKRAIEFREVGLPHKQRKTRLRKGRRAKGKQAQPQSAKLDEMLQQKLAELDALSEEEEC